MKKTPILYSAPMVIALLDDKKTQTRRTNGLDYINNNANGWTATQGAHNKTHWHFHADGYGYLVRCPYGQPGDRLWVRENFWIDTRSSVTHLKEPREVIFDATPEWALDFHGKLTRVTYFGSRTMKVSREQARKNVEANKFWVRKPSIHMPYWACRIFLKITDVRAQRLHDITETDALAEGVRPAFSYPGTKAVFSQPYYRFGFHELWETLNAKRGFGWDKNPWVWAITFRRIEP